MGKGNARRMDLDFYQKVTKLNQILTILKVIFEQVKFRIWKNHKLKSCCKFFSLQFKKKKKNQFLIKFEEDMIKTATDKHLDLKSAFKNAAERLAVSAKKNSKSEKVYCTKVLALSILHNLKKK